MTETLIDLLADSQSEQTSAQQVLKNRLFYHPFFCYKYQLHWLRNTRPEILGTDLSGSAPGGIVKNSAIEAAQLLCQFSGRRCKRLSRTYNTLPFTEGNLRLIGLSLSFLPKAGFVLFLEKRIITLEQIAAQNKITLVQAANCLIDIVENE